MYVNNNLYFVVGNLVTEIYIFQEVLIYLCLVGKSVSLTNSPYLTISSVIPFVQFTNIYSILFDDKVNLGKCSL